MRVVVKVGSNILSLPAGGLNNRRVAGLCREIAAMRGAGHEVILVSSGAVAAGRGLLGMKRRPSEIAALQAAAAVGQGALMGRYIHYFSRHGIVPAQLLLSRGDMEDRRRYLNTRNALGALLKLGALPIINENDTVTIEELKFGDNDVLSALIAAKMDAALLVILSTVPGLVDGAGATIARVDRVDRAVLSHVRASTSTHGTGGMASKLEAVRHAVKFGVRAVIADGRKAGALAAIMEGRATGTEFTAPAGARGSSRLHWISTRSAKGAVIIDDGAAVAVRRRKSLLPVGVISVSGEFEKGDLLLLSSQNGTTVARGISNYSAAEARRIAGCKGGQLAALLGQARYEELVHSDNIILEEES